MVQSARWAQRRFAMVCLFPIERNFSEQTLEGIALILFVRWLVFALVTLITSVIISIVLGNLGEIKGEEWWIALFALSFVAPYGALLFRDVLLVRRAAMHWPEKRIRSMGIISKLPWLVAFILPGYWLQKGLTDVSTTLDWASRMLLALNGLGLAVYLVYFVLLLSLGRFPSWMTLVAFVSASGMFGYSLKAETSKRAETENRIMTPR